MTRSQMSGRLPAPLRYLAQLVPRSPRTKSVETSNRLELACRSECRSCADSLTFTRDRFVTLECRRQDLLSSKAGGGTGGHHLSIILLESFIEARFSDIERYVGELSGDGNSV